MAKYTLQNEMVEKYFWWINERHRIYLKKEAGEPWPWTEDEILRDWKFTNVFRTLDRGTVWLTENWIKPNWQHEELFFNICLYRQFNWYETAEFLGYQEVYNADKVEQQLLERQAEGHRIFTNAHMLPSKHKNKVTQVTRMVLEPLWDEIEDYQPTRLNLEHAFNRLLQAYGFGPFLAYEVITDLRHTMYLILADDIYTWANPGPGAKRGIGRLHGITPGPSIIYKNYWTDAEYIEHMRHLLKIAPDQLEDHIPQPLEMRDIEHSLCEFDKYMRAYTGQGRPRLRYKPNVRNN